MSHFLKHNLLSITMLASILGLAFNTNAYAGAWVLPKGQFYMELYAKHFYADSDFDSDGTGKIAKNNNGAYHETYLEYKLEYGLFDKLNLLLDIPYKFCLSEDDNGSFRNTGLTDIRLGLKYLIIEKPILTSLQLKLSLPTEYDKNESPNLGTEYTDGEIRFLFGKSFSKIPSFIGLELGYKGRGGPKNDEVPYFLEAGYFPTKRTMLKCTIDGVEGLTRTGDEEDYAKWGVSAAYSPIGELNSAFRREGKSLSVELGYNNVFKGKNTGAGNEIVGKVIYQF